MTDKSRQLIQAILAKRQAEAIVREQAKAELFALAERAGAKSIMALEDRFKALESIVAKLI